MADHDEVVAVEGGPVDMRELKGLEIAARSRIIFKDGTWLVPSQRPGGGKYRVAIGSEPSCTCEDFGLTGKPCKHIIAARIVCERDHGGKAPKIDTDAVPKRPTYKQDWPAYNLAQTTEKHRLQVLLHDLCRGVPEPPRDPSKRGRKPVPLADQLFACAFKVYCTLSSRRFACDLADAHGRGHLSRTFHPNKINAFLENPALTAHFKALITRSSLALQTVETTFAPDSSGFSVCRFVRWYDEKYGVHRSGKDWVKVHLMCGTKTHIVTAVEILDRDAGDSPQFAALVNTTAANFAVETVSADKAYLSRDNLELVAGLGGTAYIPFKSNSQPDTQGSVWEKMYGYFQFRREEFLAHYHRRSNVESVFSAVKRKFGDAVRSKTDTAMTNEVLCKILVHNICCVILAQCELGIEAVFWQEEVDDKAEAPDVLPLVRPG
jgi:transposase